MIVYHPYYEAVRRLGAAGTERARPGALCPAGPDGASGTVLPPGLTISFVPQRGPYADLTSVVNGADHLGSPAEVYVVFADNLYRGRNPLLDLRGTAHGQVAVLASTYRPELAASHGVIAATGKPGQRLMIGLAEKPGPARTYELERRYGRGNLFLLEGRARLTAAFADFARTRISLASTEAKLALTLAEYAVSHPVRIAETSAEVTDLGAMAASRPQ